MLTTSSVEKRLKMITKVLVGSAIILEAAIGSAPASADPSPFETLSCSCQEAAAAGSPAVAHKMNLGIQDGFSSTPAVKVEQ